MSLNRWKISATLALLGVAVIVFWAVYNNDIVSHYINDMEKFEKTTLNLKTLDGKDLAAALYAPRPEDGEALRGGIVFTHMMPATKESWDALAAKFAEDGYLGLAIDLRGHGESDGGPKAYTKFTDEEHQKSILDLDAAAKFLIGKGLTAEQIVFVGASIGANLSIRYLADHHDFKTAVLFSAGLNYRGVESERAARELAAGQRILLISSKDDGENASENETIYAALKEGVIRDIKIYDRGGHGTNLLTSHSELNEIILALVTEK